MNSSCDPDVAVCPECGAEYQSHVTHCIDCGAPTRPGREFTDQQRQELTRGASLRLPEEEVSAVIRAGDLRWAESFGGFLEEHGIPWRLEVEEENAFPRKRLHHFVHVAERDLKRARELEREYLLLENPGLAAELTDLPSTDQCPACGSRVSAESSECQSCGLALDGPTDEAW